MGPGIQDPEFGKARVNPKSWILNPKSFLEAEPCLQFDNAARKPASCPAETRVGYNCASVEELDRREVQLIEGIEEGCSEFDLRPFSDLRNFRKAETLRHAQID